MKGKLDLLSLKVLMLVVMSLALGGRQTISLL